MKILQNTWKKEIFCVHTLMWKWSDYFPVSQMLYRLFLYGIVAWIFKTFPLAMEGGQVGNSTYAIGVISSTHVRTMWGEEVNFLPFWCVRTNWMTLYKHFNSLLACSSQRGERFWSKCVVVVLFHCFQKWSITMALLTCYGITDYTSFCKNSYSSVGPPFLSNLFGFQP